MTEFGLGAPAFLQFSNTERHQITKQLLGGPGWVLSVTGLRPSERDMVEKTLSHLRLSSWIMDAIPSISMPNAGVSKPTMRL